jgi:hypothetical protein
VDPPAVGSAAGLRAAGRKAAAEGQATAHRSRPALSAWHSKFPPKTWAPQDPITARGDMRTEVLTCAMQPDFAVNVICYGYGGDWIRHWQHVCQTSSPHRSILLQTEPALRQGGTRR